VRLNPADAPAHPACVWFVRADAPVNPADAPAHPADAPVNPAGEPFEPSGEPFEPSAVRFNPSSEPVEPSTVWFNPSGEPVEPSALRFNPSAVRFVTDDERIDAALVPGDDPVVRMRARDKKRLLEAFLEKRARILKLAKRHAVHFRAEPEDLVQMTWEILARRAAFGPDDDVVRLAQDAMENLVKDRQGSQDYKRLRFASHKKTRAVDDYAPVEWVDEAGEEVDDERLHAHAAPSPERAVLEKERVETYRAFFTELKESLDSVERAIIEAGEKDADDTADLEKQLRCSRERIYKARFTIKQKALKLRARWAAAGRELPGF
jgi:hypothetical protein